ncbi:MAG: hypothetical protein HRT61_23640 [Ekhidna sp.]|nr:hypothetical protein [Ekhidna sp.]
MKGTNKKNEPRIDTNLNEYEAKERMNTYAHQVGDLDKTFKILNIQNKWAKELKKNQDNRTKAEIYRAQGVGRGLDHAHPETLKDQHYIIDQGKQNEALKEAKSVYQSGESLQKEYSKADPPLSAFERQFLFSSEELVKHYGNDPSKHTPANDVQRDFSKVSKRKPLHKQFNKKQERDIDKE